MRSDAHGLQAHRQGLPAAEHPRGPALRAVPEDVLGELRKAGYAGWYVLEQDVMLDREPAPGPPRGS